MEGSSIEEALERSSFDFEMFVEESEPEQFWRFSRARVRSQLRNCSPSATGFWTIACGAHKTLYLLLLRCFAILFISIFKHLFAINSPNLSLSIKSLRQKYLVEEGLMLNIENAKIIKILASDINFDCDSLIVDCVAFSDKELIPGTDAIKQSVAVVKQEFDSRVTGWLFRLMRVAAIKRPAMCLILTGEVSPLTEPL